MLRDIFHVLKKSPLLLYKYALLISLWNVLIQIFSLNLVLMICRFPAVKRRLVILLAKVYLLTDGQWRAGQLCPRLHRIHYVRKQKLYYIYIFCSVNLFCKQQLKGWRILTSKMEKLTETVKKLGYFFTGQIAGRQSSVLF